MLVVSAGCCCCCDWCCCYIVVVVVDVAVVVVVAVGAALWFCGGLRCKGCRRTISVLSTETTAPPAWHFRVACRTTYTVTCCVATTIINEHTSLVTSMDNKVFASLLDAPLHKMNWRMFHCHTRENCHMKKVFSSCSPLTTTSSCMECHQDIGTKKEK